jgi:hypothetical protein
MIRFLLLFCLVAAPFSSVLAVEVDVYTGETPVSGQAASERRQALPAALANALQKHSGLRSLDDIPEAAPVLQSASSILVTFFYRNAERILADGTSSEELRLVAKFSPNEIDELARSLQLPLWPALRNPLEVWVVVDDGRQREILPLETAFTRDSLQDVADLRGQPLVWPEPDEEGMYPVDMQLLWGGYTEDLASLNGVGVLILAARREGARWGIRANLGYRGEHFAWRLQDFDIEAGLLEGLNNAIDQVAARSAIAASDQGVWTRDLTISGLHSSGDYQDCLAYLQGIGIVDRVTVLFARPDGMAFRLELNASPNYLDEAFARAGVLEPADEENLFLFQGNERP